MQYRYKSAWILSPYSVATQKKDPRKIETYPYMKGQTARSTLLKRNISRCIQNFWHIYSLNAAEFITHVVQCI